MTESSHVDIRFLDKICLIYNLWQAAKKSPYLKHYDEKISLTTAEIEHDIMCMADKLSFTIYYGKVLLVDVTGDILDTRDYNFYNGKNKANLIIEDIKNNELSNLIIYLAKR